MAVDRRFQRLELLYGSKAVEKLANSTVTVFGCGGVGSMCIEALARSGVGRLVIVDKDDIDISNLNRQIMALEENVGRMKVSVMKERIEKINPACEVICYPEFYDRNNEKLWEIRPDYVADCIDTVTCKLDLIEYCQKHSIPFICATGTGNRFDPTKITVTDLAKTSYDPLAKAMRIQARKRGIKGKIPVVWCTEKPKVQNIIVNPEGLTQKEKTPPASSAFVPNAAGLVMASVIVNALTNTKGSQN